MIFMIYIYAIWLIYHFQRALASALVLENVLPESLAKLASVLLAMSLFSLNTPSTEKSSTLALNPPSN